VPEGKNTEQKFKRIYHELINGYSSIDYEGKKVFVKHISEHDLGALEQYGDAHHSEAKSKGLPTEDEQLNILIKGGLWSTEQEDKIKNLKETLASLNESHKNLFLKRQIKQSQEKINEVSESLSSLLQERVELIGLTCEKYAERKSNEEIVYHCFFEDEGLTRKFFTRQEFEELHHSKLYDCIKKYNEVSNKFSYEEMKRLAACTFFTNLFFSSDADLYKFYGKGVVQLSGCQLDVFNVSRLYKSIMEQGTSPPQELYEDIDKVVSFFDSFSSGNSTLKEAGNKDSQSIVGASIEEMKQMTKGTEGNESVITLDSALSKLEEEGKDINNLSMEEIAKMHGY
tara:strand:+ start:6024 stop:7046 length:1023 start_codon:yes stop_codon:yes gene_type:complete